MNADDFELPDAEESRRIIGCAMALHNEIGHGLREKTYENGIVVAFRNEGIPYDQQRRFPVHYLGEKIDDFIPDLIVFDRIVLDLKTIEKITDVEIGQMLNYLRVTKLKLGLIINFKHPKLQVRRVVL